MRVENMTSSRGNKVPSQHIITDNGIKTFQSYDSIIATIEDILGPATDSQSPNRKEYLGERVTLDKNYWDYSRTTSKYRNQFLCETTKETQAKIKSGEYILADLNT